MNMNRRTFLVKGSAITGLVIVGIDEAGCPTAEQWFQIAAGLVPIVLQTVSGLETGVGGLSPDALAAITTFGSVSTTLLNDVAADIKTAQTDTTVIPKIQALLMQLQTQAKALLTQFAGNDKISAWVNAILADAIDLFNLVPVLQQAAGTSTSLAKVTVIKTNVSLPKAKTYKAVFEHRLAVAKAA
jgi:hypothetical protein